MLVQGLHEQPEEAVPAPPPPHQPQQGEQQTGGEQQGGQPQQPPVEVEREGDGSAGAGGVPRKKRGCGFRFFRVLFKLQVLGV